MVQRWFRGGSDVEEFGLELCVCGGGGLVKNLGWSWGKNLGQGIGEQLGLLLR